MENARPQSGIHTRIRTAQFTSRRSEPLEESKSIAPHMGSDRGAEAQGGIADLRR